MATKRKVTVAKGVKVPWGTEEKLSTKAGSSPVNTLKRARAALAYAHYAPNPEGIRKAVYAKYPDLKKRHEEREKKDRR